MATDWIAELAKRVIDERDMRACKSVTGDSLFLTLNDTDAIEKAVDALTADQREELAKSVRQRNTGGMQQAFRDLHIDLRNSMPHWLSSYGAQVGLYWAIRAELSH